MKIVSLNPANQRHTHVVVALVIESSLEYGEPATDPRLLTWAHCQGRWAAATTDSGEVAGIACVVGLSDQPGDALLWLEVLPDYQHQGYGSALLGWAQAQSERQLRIDSVASAIGFYQRAAVALPEQR